MTAFTSDRTDHEDPDDDGTGHLLGLTVPNLTKPPSTPLLVSVGASMVMLVLVAVISVIVTRASAPKPSAGTADSTINACNVVPASAASTAFGHDAGIPHLVLGSCVYDDGAGNELIVSVTSDNARAQFDSSRPAGAQAVAGVSSQAYYANGRLFVLKGSNLLLLAMAPFSGDAPAQKLLDVATGAAARL